MNAQVLKYAKTVYQLEKGLPPNGVVPKLKVKVEDMKDKVCQPPTLISTRISDYTVITVDA